MHLLQRKLELFEELNGLQDQIDRIAPPYEQISDEYAGPLGIVLTSPSGKQTTLDLFGRSNTPASGNPPRHKWDASDLESIDTFLAILSVPELREEFSEAARKILRKGDRVLDAAKAVANAKNPDANPAKSKHETYKEHPLYADELERQRELADLNARKKELCVKLKLANPHCRHEHLPTSREVELAGRKVRWRAASIERASSNSLEP